jgi:AraC family transcriptional regulator, activator of mtrCDE
MLKPPVEDVLTAVIAAYGVRAMLTDDSKYCGEWREAEPTCHQAYLHLIDQGSCLMSGPFTKEPVLLEAGDFIVLPHGAAHELTSCPGAKRDDYTTMLCGNVEFVHGARNPLLKALPQLILVRAADGGERFRHLGQLLCAEIRGGGFGGRAVVDKLADALFVMAVRHYINNERTPKGLVAALLDGRISKSLAAIHAQPGLDWTVASMADVAGMSRTAFALRFGELLGQSPIHYLTEWRMTEAEKLLQDPRQSVRGVAERLGYQTEAAFRRSFKRVLGYGPGQVRKAAAA